MIIFFFNEPKYRGDISYFVWLFTALKAIGSALSCFYQIEKWYCQGKTYIVPFTSIFTCALLRSRFYRFC